MDACMIAWMLARACAWMLAWMLARALASSRHAPSCVSHTKTCWRRGGGQDDGSRFSFYDLCLPQSAIACVSVSRLSRGAPVSAGDTVARLFPQKDQRD